MTAEGKLILCLGNESALDLKALVRRYPNQPQKLRESLLTAVKSKPKQHQFNAGSSEHIVRFMNMTGG
jgi:cyclic pyranopterin phosphate synthase